MSHDGFEIALNYHSKDEKSETIFICIYIYIYICLYYAALSRG